MTFSGGIVLPLNVVERYFYLVLRASVLWNISCAYGVSIKIKMKK